VRNEEESTMITAIVRFKLKPGTTQAAATEMFRNSVPRYQGRAGLVRKYYLFGDGYGGGVYLWKSRSDAEQLYTPEWRDAIAERYGAPPEITLYESPVIVDNSTQEVLVDAA
jgi:hypothetical protein